MSDYRDPVIDQYLELIKSNCNGRIKHFYQGEPIAVPSVDLPCVIISKQETRVGPISNAEDEHGIGMSLTLIVDIRDDLSTQESAREIAAGIASLYELMEGRDTDLTLQEHSILGIMRGTILVNAGYGLRTDLQSITRVDYGTTLRDRNKQSWTIEARLDFVAHFTQVR